jgi:hypothetical protein
MKSSAVLLFSLFIISGSAFASQITFKPGGPVDSVSRTEASASGLEISASGGRNAAQCVVSQAVAAQIGYSIGELQMILNSQAVVIACEFTGTETKIASKIKVISY